MHFYDRFLFIVTVIFTLSILSAKAQDTGGIQGIVSDAATHEPLAGINVVLQHTTKGAVTDSDGGFRMRRLPTGTYTLIFSSIGYKKVSQPVSVTADKTSRVAISMEQDVTELNSIHVTALRPDQISAKTLRESDVQQANPRDSGELLRKVKGVDAVRRGPLGLDPVVRGLRETEVGTYLNGTRIFPGGPARMDSPLSHLDPSSIQSIQVVKGPYALNWGAGNMSAVKVKIQPLTAIKEDFGGSVSSGYDSNLNALEEAATFKGKIKKFGYWVHGALRKGQNYESGNGSDIPANFLSREIRGKIGYAFTPHSKVDLSLGYQNQKDLDYPGRLLDATYFHTVNASANWEWSPQNSILSAVKAKAYINNVEHEMNNDDKPTAKADSSRMPPFPLKVGVKAHARVSGGKVSTQLDLPENWTLEAGADIYSANRNAVRTIDRRNKGMKPPAFPLTDLMWPDATITDGGMYTKADHAFTDQLSASATVRLDLVSADADTISRFFADNVSTDLEASETNLSGSFTLNYLPAENWAIGFGAGSAVRTADATERYSDRTPASKAQTSAEFVGNPALKPERNTQADIWISADYSRWSLSLNGFARRMSNFITLRTTNLPKRLPLSPNTVYQYINGSAKFWGFEVGGTYHIIRPLTFNADFNYLWGKDTKLDEPALGISPFNVDTGLRYESTAFPFFAESTVHISAEQDRVASLKGETSTEGYVTADILAGVTLWNNVYFQAGVKNIANKQYVNHLNAKNPFTKQPVPEPGRVVYGDITIRF